MDAQFLFTGPYIMLAVCIFIVTCIFTMVVAGVRLVMYMQFRESMRSLSPLVQELKDHG